MTQLARKSGEREVLSTLRISLEKCSISLGMELTDQTCAILCEDIFEKYKYDSVEDIVECLKKARRGYYGFGHNSRKSLNMVLISEWMAKHLEEKAIEREKELQNQKKEGVEIQGKVTEAVKKIVNYDAFKEAVEKGQPTNEKENEFQRLKLERIEKGGYSPDAKKGPIELAIELKSKNKKS